MNLGGISMTLLPTPIAALGLAALALAASGCGKSSTTSTTSAAAGSAATTAIASQPTTPVVITVAKGTPLPRATWIARGDAVCKATNAKLSATVAKTTADFVRLLPQAAIYEHTEAVELSKLVPPPAMAANWARMVNETQGFSEDSIKLAAYVRAKNSQTGRLVLHAVNRLQQGFTTLARRYGFKICSNL
jgi:hypothetical protein